MRVLQLAVPAADSEIGADRLWSLGACSVEEFDLGDGTTGLRTVLDGDPTAVLRRLGPLDPAWAVSWVEVDDRPSEAWRDFARPVAVGDSLVLRPAWLAPVGDGRLEVVIEPGAAFGLGDHPTTRLTAEATRRCVRLGDRVLDVGCGTGVLGIVAALAGAVSVRSIDIAPAAIEATLDNAARNGVAARFVVSTDRIDEIDGVFDLVVANLLSPTIVAMAEHLRRLIAPGGALLVSGILADHHDHVEQALSPLELHRRDVLDAWCCLELRHPDRPG